MGISIFDETHPYIDYEQIDNAWGTAVYPVAGGSDPPVRIDSMIVTSTDTIAHDLQLWGSLNAVAQTLIGTVSIPAGAGDSIANPAIDLIPLLFPTTLGFVASYRHQLAVGPTVAVVAAHFIYVTTQGGYL